jgi:hypothetical protein
MMTIRRFSIEKSILIDSKKWPKLTNIIDYIVVFVFVFHNHMEQWLMSVHMHMLHPLYVYMDNIDHDDIR